MKTRASRFDWNDIPILLALAREGRMRLAARSLGLDVSTVSRRLAAAEKQLDARLFVRGPSGYEVTDAGRAFLQAAEQIEGGVRGLLHSAAAASANVAGVVRVTSVDALLDQWLVPRLPSLLSRHPDLDLRLIPDNKNLSFTRREADLALRIARPKDDAAVRMRRVGRIGLAVYGAPVFKRVSRDRWPELPWIAYDEDLAHVPEMDWLHRVAPGARARLRVSSVPSVLEACAAGVGLALLPCVMVRSSRLVRLSATPEVYREMWLLSHRDTAKIPRFKAVADWIAAHARQDEAALGGDAKSGVTAR